jgi:hypothetical protein
VAGFFIVEDTVLGTTTRLLSKQWVDDLWDAAVTEIARALQSQLDTFNDAAVILEVKELIVHFSQSYGCVGVAAPPPTCSLDVPLRTSPHIECHGYTRQLTVRRFV